jgi:hypothetical protein
MRFEEPLRRVSWSTTKGSSFGDFTDQLMSVRQLPFNPPYSSQPARSSFGVAYDNELCGGTASYSRRYQDPFA